MEDRVKNLRFYLKTLRQIQPKPGIAFNPHYHDLHTILNNWFQQELEYHQEFSLSPSLLHAFQSQDRSKQIPSYRPKILCNLSTDQIALILRSADEAKILQARSLNEIFKNIVPFLSTPRKEELSPQGVRSRMYNVE